MVTPWVSFERPSIIPHEEPNHIVRLGEASWRHRYTQGVSLLKSSPRDADGANVSDQPVSVIPLLHALASTNGSDLHCKVGAAPRIRIDGRLRKLQVPPLRPEDTRNMVAQVLPEDLVLEFRETHEADFAFSLSGVGRFRVNAYVSRGMDSLVFRRVAVGAQSMAELGLPEVVGSLALEPRGLVLVTGPTGSGK